MELNTDNRSPNETILNVTVDPIDLFKNAVSNMGLPDPSDRAMDIIIDHLVDYVGTVVEYEDQEAVDRTTFKDRILDFATYLQQVV